MPEYLSPGVYVEEIDTGNKPIEGVSTTTAGMLGVTERGPVNVPILITSYGEYRRWFGERLLLSDFSNALGPHCYLPHAVEGFFQNEGQRVYVTRILDVNGAVNASENLFDRGALGSPETLLLRTAGEETGTLANPPLLFVLDSTGLNPGVDWIRVGDGSLAEYRLVNTVNTAPADMLVALGLPLALPHAAGDEVDEFAVTNDAAYAGAVTLTNRVTPGVSEFDLSFATAADVANMHVGQLFQIGGLNGEYHIVAKVTPTPSAATILLEAPLAMAYDAGTAIQPLTTPAVPATPPALSLAAGAGDSLIFPNTNAGFTNVAHLVRIHSSIANLDEIRRIGAVSELEVSPGAYFPYPAASIVEKVDLSDDNRHLTVAVPGPPPPNTNTITLDDATGLAVSDSLTIDPGPNQEIVTVQSVAGGVVTFTPDLVNGHALGTIVTPAFSLKILTSAAPAGSLVVAVDNRTGLALNDVIRIGVAPQEEYARITGLPDPAGTAPDAGIVLLDHALFASHASGDEVRRQGPALVDTTNPSAPTGLVLPAATGSTMWVISDGNNYGAAPLQFARVTTPTGQVVFHRLLAVPAIVPAEVSVTMPPPFTPALERAHAAGSVFAVRKPLINVEALDAGAWGNRLRISIEDESPGLVSRSQIAAVVNPTHIRLSSVAGVEVGTVLELLDPLNGDAVVGPLLKVVFIDRTSNYTLTLQGTGLTAAQQTAQTNAIGAGTRLGVRSREFRMTVLLMHQPDPSLPSRSEVVSDSEVFRNLSMDSRHSHYFQTIVGVIGGPPRLEDRRPEGQSWYVRVQDLGADPESIRLGPETLVDVLPNGRTRPARLALESGNDSIATITDDTYIGLDNVIPEQRTGLFSFVNIDDLSILSVPGRTSPALQGAVIDFCENNRYCFAVLDGPVPNQIWSTSNDSLSDVQQQRQQFDTKYAALYYPWVLIEDPFPVNLAKIANYPIPPSGHVIGVFARTDIDRGVHKAPANEVVNGIIGLQRIVNKPEQDILNPYPVNINVIRDFRHNERGIRIWGGRVITSDTDWKYVNVRRLLIFIEKSIDLGLQWVVFEPNADPLWARVRRTIGNFLTTVWRNGGLEGTKTEEAYFVKCDRTTMTQTDIDNGRLIVVIGVAPVKPAEFVIIRIGLFTANANT